MDLNRWIVGSLVLIMLALGCSSAKNKQQTDTPQSGDIPAISQEDAQDVLQNLQENRMGDSTLFPYVYQGPGKSNIFEAYSMRFSLRYEEPLQPLLNTQVGWVDPSLFNENNGLFITYIREGREVSLNNPYIQVQYLNKQLPYVSTIDSIYLWLDGVNLQASDAVDLGGNITLPTASGKNAQLKDYFTGTIQNRTPKYLAYAYIDYNEEYILGLALTTTIKSDYDLTKPAFHKLVKSLMIH